MYSASPRITMSIKSASLIVLFLASSLQINPSLYFVCILLNQYE